MKIEGTFWRGLQAMNRLVSTRNTLCEFRAEQHLKLGNAILHRCSVRCTELLTSSRPWMLGLLVWIAVAGFFGGFPVHAQNANTRPLRRTAEGAAYVPKNNLFQLPSVRVALGRLSQPAGFRWEQKELRGALQELAENARVSIWIDRRIDPNTKIDLRPTAETSIQAAMQSVAELIGGSVGLVENVVYLGPTPKSASLVQAAAVRMHDALGNASHSSSTELKKFAWERVSTPGQLLQRIETDWRTQIQAQVPYDLWHPMDLGTCSLATQVTLVLAGFELQPIYDRDQIGVGPLEDNGDWQFAYPANMLNPDAVSRAARLASIRAYGGSMRQQGSSFLVTGPSNLHLQALKPANTRKAMQQNLDSRVVSLEVNKEFEPLMRELAASIGFELKLSEALSQSQLRHRVEFFVKQVSVDQLLQRCATSAGVRVQREGAVVTVSPR